jgi:hypothetical protein
VTRPLQDTWEAMVSLINGTTRTLDMTVMYWSLIAANTVPGHKNYTQAVRGG